MSSSFRTPAAPEPARAILLEALPVGAAVAAYGVSYGVLAVAAGMSPLAATIASVVVLAGGSQFAFVGVLAAGGAPLAGAAAGLMVNARYLGFGVAIASHLPGGPRWRRLLDGYLVVDESVALALGRGDADRARRFRLAGWTVVVAWTGASAVGAYGGALIGDPGAYGLDAAFPAGFLALLAPWLRTRQGRVAAAVGAGLALGLAPVAPPGIPIVAAALGAVAAMGVRPRPADGAQPGIPSDGQRVRAPDRGPGHGSVDEPGPAPGEDLDAGLAGEPGVGVDGQPGVGIDGEPEPAFDDRAATSRSPRPTARRERRR
jgi:predicted branched-subunit amino acid permease